MYFARAILALQVAADLFHKIWCGRSLRRLDIQPQWRSLGASCFFSGDFAIFKQAVDHEIAPAECTIRKIHGRITSRALAQSGDQSSLFQLQGLRAFAKVVPSTRLESIHAVPRRDLIAIDGS